MVILIPASVNWISSQIEVCTCRLTCRVTSTGFCLTGESASSSMKRTVLQIRRTMKMMGMSVSFMSAMEKKEDWGLLARMGRYSDRAECCGKGSKHMQQRNKKT